MNTSKQLYEKALKYLKEKPHGQNKNLAFETCKSSADMGYMPAINLLGIFYSIGYGTSKNRRLARKSFEKCGDEASDVAIYNIGILDIVEKGFGARMSVACYFSANIQKIKNKKMAEFIINMRRSLSGDIYATASNIGMCMLLVSMEEKFAFLDEDCSINFVNLQGCIDDKSKNVLDMF